MIDFASIAREAAAKKAAEQPVIRETLRVTPISAAAYLMKDDADWTAEDLRDYVMSQIEQRHGPQLRNTIKETAVFRSFLGRYGIQAVQIARFACEVERALWQRAPLSVNHFCKKADWWFGDKITERL